MSHELRTPLNSLLILSDQLCKNPDGNLSAKQVEFSKTIHSSGNDLLMLINDILDLSKIESGTVAVDVSELRVDDLHRSVERSFRHFAESKHVDFVDRARASRCPRRWSPTSSGCSRSSRTCCPTRSSSRTRARSRSAIATADRRLVARTTTSCTAPAACWRSRCAIPASASRPTSSRSSSRPSSRPTARPRASTAAPAWAWRSAASCRAAGRRDPPGQRAGQGQHVHAVPAAELQPGAQRASRARERSARRRDATEADAAAARAARRPRRGLHGLRDWRYDESEQAGERRRRLRQRRRRRPRQHRHRRPRAADRRERPGLRARAARRGARRPASRAWSPAPAPAR